MILIQKYKIIELNIQLLDTIELLNNIMLAWKKVKVYRINLNNWKEYYESARGKKELKAFKTNYIESYTKNKDVLIKLEKGLEKELEKLLNVTSYIFNSYSTLSQNLVKIKKNEVEH